MRKISGKGISRYRIKSLEAEVFHYHTDLLSSAGTRLWINAKLSDI